MCVTDLWVDNPEGSGANMNAYATLADRHERVLAGNPPKQFGVSAPFESEFSKAMASSAQKLMMMRTSKL